MLTVHQAIDEWLTEKARHLAAASIRQYRGQIEPFRDSLGEQETFADLTRQRLLDYLHARRHWEDGEEKSTATQRIAMTILQQFLEWAMDLDYLGAMPLKKADLRKPMIGQRSTLPTTQQVQAILSAAADRPDWQKLYMALRLTGCRPGELINANIPDIEQTDAGPVLLLRKHKTVRKVGARRVPLSVDVNKMVRQAIGSRTAGPIFRTRQGRRWSVESASRLFRQYREECGLPREIVFYCTRHEFGTIVTQQAGIDATKALLGHTNITTTQRYSHPSLQRLQDVQADAAAALNVRPDHGQETHPEETGTDPQGETNPPPAASDPGT